MLKELWDQLLGELVLIDDNEGVAAIRPPDEVGILGLVKETAKFLLVRRII